MAPGRSSTAEAIRGELARLQSYLLQPVTLFRGYRREHLTPDLAAGLTVAAVAVPQGMAYATIAELPPQVGLYAAAVGSVVAALWGSSKYLATGPTNANSLLVLAVLLGIAAPGEPLFVLGAAVMAVLSGIFLIVLAGLRFGALAALASRPVLLGFTAGAAVLIAVGQLRHLLGVDVASSPELQVIVEGLAAHAHQTHLPTVAVGVGTVAVVLIVNLIHKRLPAALIAIVVSAIVVWLTGLHDSGVRVMGEIPRSLPPLTWRAVGQLPDVHFVRSLFLGSMAVAALGLVEAVAVAQSLARKAGDRLDTNQEFFGQGLANVAVGLLSGYPCAGSLTRSALNHQAGARTQVSGIIAGVAVLAAMLVAAPYAGLIPKAALAGVVLVVAARMVERHGIARVLKASPAESAIMVLTFLATLTLPLEFAVLAGVVVSLGLFVVRASLPRVYPTVPDATFRHLVEGTDRPECPQLAIMTIRGPLFFGAVQHVEEALRRHLEEHTGQVFLVLRLHGVDICDLTGIEMLESTLEAHRKLGGDLFVIRPRRPVLELMEESGFLERLGEDHVLPQEGAIEHLFDEVLDPAVCCYECQSRVFAECQALDKHDFAPELPAPQHREVDPSLHLTPGAFRAFVEEAHAHLIDVREAVEFRAGHLPEARLVPLSRLVELAPALPRDRPLALVCRSGRRSTRAMYMLGDLGFEGFCGIKGGILAWRAEGLPIQVEEGPIDGDEAGPTCPS